MDPASGEGQVGLFWDRYLDLVRGFLIYEEGPEDEPRNNREKLLWYIKRFSDLHKLVVNMPPTIKAQAEERINLAEKWCRSRYEMLQSVAERASASGGHAPYVEPVPEEKAL
jgi:hypothetical protein